MPRQPEENDIANYHTLLTHLYPSPPCLLDIDVLPPSLCPTIQYSPSENAIGVPKDVLVACFLIARGVFFTDDVNTNSTAAEGVEATQHDGEGIKPYKAQRLEDEDGEKKLGATAIILLFDPNHLSALNYRKRFLASCGHDNAVIVEQELHFLESLLRSPMRRHNKSSALFNHRLWVLHRFIVSSASISNEDRREVWTKELEIVMVAGDKHLANYYAWNYAREVWGLVFMTGGGSWEDDEMAVSLEKVLSWCFRHPRDISGWNFLVWLLERGLEESRIRGLEQLNLLLGRVLDWKIRIAWEGGALDCFISRARKLTGHDGDGNDDEDVSHAIRE